MRSILLSLALGLAAVGTLGLAPSEARAFWRGRPAVVVGYPPPAYYPPPVVYSSYHVTPAYYSAPSYYVTPAYPSYYVAPAYYGGYVGWRRGYVRWAGYYP